MTTINTLIVDDEQLARQKLTAYVERMAELKLVGTARSAAEATGLLAKQRVDVLLLDIQMPRTKGTDFLRSLSKPPLVVFTTAYTQHAMTGYELNAVDYLLKPIGFERFSAAIEKVRSRLEQSRKAAAFDANQPPAQQQVRTLIIKEGHNYRKLPLHTIDYISAMREYVSYHTDEGKFLELKALSALERELPTEHFLRVHRSFIVARAAVQAHRGNQLLLRSGQTVPIGKTYKHRILELLFSR